MGSTKTPIFILPNALKRNMVSLQKVWHSLLVWSNAIKRFGRLVCFQDYLETLLPITLQSENKLHIWRMVNGKMKQY